MDGVHCTSAHGEKVVAQSAFTYDTVGNRTDQSAVLVAGNRLTSFNGFTLAYDYDGNVTHKSAAGFSQYLYWNSIGQLDSVVTMKNDTTIVRFGYDSQGRRVRRSTATRTVRFIYSGANLVAEIDSATNSTIRIYTFLGTDAPLSVDSGGRKYYYLRDASAGHVVALIDSAGNIKNHYRYAPYGALEDSSESVSNSLRYTSREYDAESQLYYYRSRYYDPSLSRFVSEDPIGLNGGINTFAYAGGDPVNRVDPFGTSIKDYVNGFPCIPKTDGSCMAGSGGGGSSGDDLDPSFAGSEVDDCPKVDANTWDCSPGATTFNPFKTKIAIDWAIACSGRATGCNEVDWATFQRYLADSCMGGFDYSECNGLEAAFATLATTSVPLCQELGENAHSRWQDGDVVHEDAPRLATAEDGSLYGALGWSTGLGFGIGTIHIAHQAFEGDVGLLMNILVHEETHIESAFMLATQSHATSVGNACGTD